MKTKYNAIGYKLSFAHHDVQIVERLKAYMNLKIMIGVSIWFFLNGYLIFKSFNNACIIVVTVVFSVLLLLLCYLSFLEYKVNRIFKVLVKHYLVRNIMCIYGITMSIIAIMYFDNQYSELWGVFVFFLAMLTLSISYFINRKYMNITKEVKALPALAAGTVFSLLAKSLEGFAFDMLFVILVMFVVSCLSSTIIRSIRLLKLEAEELTK